MIEIKEIIKGLLFTVFGEFHALLIYLLREVFMYSTYWRLTSLSLPRLRFLSVSFRLYLVLYGVVCLSRYPQLIATGYGTNYLGCV